MFASLTTVVLVAASAGSPLLVAEDAVSRGRFQEACDAWVEAVRGGGQAALVAWERLDRHFDYCDLSGAAERIVRGQLPWADPAWSGNARASWRAARVARLVVEKYLGEEAVAALVPRDLESREERWIATDAPFTDALALAPPASDAAFTREPGSSAGSDGVLVSRRCFAVGQPGPWLVRVTFPSAGSVWAGGKPLLTSDGTARSRDKRVQYAGLDLAGGLQCFDVLVASDNLTEDLTIRVLPAAARPGAAAACLLGDPTLCGWWELATQDRTSARLTDLLAAGRQAPAPRMLALAVLEREAEGQDVDRMALEMLISAHGDRDCYSGLELASRYLSTGDAPRADRVMDALGPACTGTAPGMLLSAQVAEAQQWTSIRDALTLEAFRRYPTVCRVALAWLERSLDLGVLPAQDAVAVHCREFREAREKFVEQAAGGPRALVAADELARRFWKSGRTERNALLRESDLSDSDPAVQALLDAAMFRDPQAVWTVADRELARQDAGSGPASTRLLERVREHAGTYAPLRAQAGKLGEWGRLLPHMTDPESIVTEYVDTGFAAGMPSVIVLDEGVLLPSGNGWGTYLETSLVHVQSADAAEQIGEVSLAPGQEFVDLAVRKEDGTWLAPLYDADGVVKETVSLPGLAPGDFVLKSTVREMAFPGGSSGCNAVSDFYFGSRQSAVYLSRLVVLDPVKRGLAYTVRGSLDTRLVKEDAWEFAAGRVEPAALEPFASDPEFGLAAVHIQSACYDWPGMRDRTADALARLCDVPLPDEAAGHSRSVEDLYAWVMETVRPDGQGVMAAPFGKILASGQGSGALAVYCAMTQSGREAELVLVNSAAARPLLLHRPGLAAFDAAVVRVREEGREVWLDPYDRAALAGGLRPVLRNRPGMVLAARYPRVLLTTPDVAGTDRWLFTIDARAEAGGAATGELVLHGWGVAAAELAGVLRDAPQARAEQVAQAILGQVVPRAEAGAHSFDVAAGKATLRVPFAVSGSGRSDGLLLFLLPPAPMAEHVRLGSRASPEFFPGLLPTETVLTVEAGDGVQLATRGNGAEVKSWLGSFAVTASVDPERVRVSKVASADPRVVEPARYGDLVTFMRDLQSHFAVAVEVKGALGE